MIILGLVENWFPFIWLLLLGSGSLSVYTFYLRRKFHYNTYSLKKAFSNSPTNPFQFGKQSNSKIRQLITWSKVTLLLFILTDIATFVLLIMTITEVISNNSIDNPWSIIIVSSFAVGLGILFNVIAQKKMTLQIKHYQQIKNKVTFAMPIQSFFDSQAPSVGFRILSLSIINLVCLWSAIFATVMLLAIPNLH